MAPIEPARANVSLLTYDAAGAQLQRAPDGTVLTGEEEITMNEFEKVRGRGDARVEVGFSQKISGPHYSSVEVRVTVSVPCDAKTVTAAADLAFGAAAELVDGYAKQAYPLLLSTIEETRT